ncbi:hypothetical protein SLOPH_1812 [Spraguea lophii 42_110]|uniref:Uncharacterized protein n=1 Tax=Spraguea lophii (strain 42_110) TaxID=1358809 RepID=S7W9C8_SPRLO|nr:hypothetical protein SLOPH_1812 [Spraguea lophii 42_110]
MNESEQKEHNIQNNTDEEYIPLNSKEENIINQNRIKQVKRNHPHKSYVELRKDLIKFIRTENDNYDEEEKDKIIEIIKTTIINSDDKNLYKKLIEELKFMEDPHKFVSKFLLYYRRTCRNGKECKIKDCFFNHHPDIKGFRKKEIVINKIPENLQNPETILSYCSQFGDVQILKILKPSKYLLKFDDEENASKFINDKLPIMGDETITKFYNIFTTDKEKLLELIQEEQKIIKELFSKGEKDIANNLKQIQYKMKKIILQLEDE